MQQGIAKGSIVKWYILFIVMLIVWPLPFAHYMKYDISGGYVSLAFFVFLSPAVFFLSKSYWNNKTTIVIWCLRALAVIEFLVTYYSLGINGMDLVSFGGTLGLTFFYEMGYLLVASSYFGRFLHFWLWLNMALVVFLLVLVVPIAMRGGITGIINHVSEIRTWIPYWPNCFAIYLMILFWIAIFFARTEDKKYSLLLVPILAILFLTSSRTAVVALGGSILFAVWRERR